MGALIDLMGRTFGRLTVIGRAENDKWQKARWLCECECGTKKIILGNDLRSGMTKSCGCFRAEVNDLIGHRFGMLVVLELVSVIKGEPRWRCKCDCGEEKTILGSNLTRIKYSTKSCGCLHRRIEK
mgnify:CR=1 FL=1|jgi:hypothetical protein